jgi:hypothetical protein
MSLQQTVRCTSKLHIQNASVITPYPADAATRGVTVAELRAHKNWLHGPDFLYNQHNEWPTQPEAATDIYAELLPEAHEGVRRDNKN